MSGGFSQLPELCSSLNTWPTWDGSDLTAVTSGTGPAYGAWTQLVSSLPNDVTELVVHLTSGGSDQGSFNIGVGGSGSEIVLIPNIVYSGSAIVSLVFPVSIPAGTRISVQAAVKTGTQTQQAGLTYSGPHGFISLESFAYDNIGYDAVNIGGTPITSGAAGVYGSYTQLVSAAASDYAGFVLMLDGQNGAFSTADNGKVKVAVGGSGSEVDLFSALACQGFRNIGETAFGNAAPFYFPVAAGTRISAAFVDTAGAATLGLSLIGIKR